MSLEEEMDQMFVVIMGMIVVFLQAGFAFLEAGAVRSKNVTNILIKNVCDAFVSGFAYWLFGYAFAYGEGNEFIGWKHFALKDLPQTSYAGFFFQYTFAATAATIVSGSVAERCEIVAYFVYSFFITGFIYPVVSRWQWGGGFLVNGVDYGGEIGVVGYTDFAGSGVLHVLGGVAAFCGAFMLGPRIGRFHKETHTAVPIRGHSVPISALGGFILFFGFLAFNGGSLTSISNDGDGAIVSRSVVNTVISGSFAAFSTMFIYKTKFFGSSKWSLLVTINGVLTGMVGVCAGCNAMYPWGACIIGCLAGVVFHFFSFLVRRVGVDDPVDAVAVHLGGGILGVIAIAFLHKEEGIFFNWNRRSGLILAWQFAGLSVIIAWTTVLSLTLFGVLKVAKLLRVPRDVELKGLDFPEHDEPAYPIESYGHGHVETILQYIQDNPFYVTHVFKRLSLNAGHDFTGIQDFTGDSSEKELPDQKPDNNLPVGVPYIEHHSEPNSAGGATVVIQLDRL